VTPTFTPGPSASSLTHSITDRSVSWPTWDQFQRVLLLSDYNTRLVVLGTLTLGAAAGLIGSFMLLRKRALLGDALSHATLPGIVLAFLFSVAAGGTGKGLSVLLLGGSITAVLGVLAVLLIRRYTRIKEDAALGVVLSVFFGLGVALLGIAQRTGQGNSAGLESFIYGKAASMVALDATLIGAVALTVTLICILLFKELKLLCFDTAYAGGQGWPTLRLDLILMAMVVTITVTGLQAVGLILVIALLIIPAAAARFWSDRLAPMAMLAALLGGLSAGVGASMSALFPRMPSGAMIVLVAALVFLVSMIFGRSRGILARALRRHFFNRKVGRQHLLRAMFEVLDSEDEPCSDLTLVQIDRLLALRSWSPRALRREIARAHGDELVVPAGDNAVRFSPGGLLEARRLVRQHRLWEMYLITHADIAPSHVDRDADAIEHILSPELIAQLEELAARKAEAPRIPHSPHAIGVVSPA